MSEIKSVVEKAIEEADKSFSVGTVRQFRQSLIIIANAVRNNRKQILSALQEKSEREKGCEYCNGEALNGAVTTKIFGVPKIALHSGGTSTEPERFKFCPNCGRDLRKPVTNN